MDLFLISFINIIEWYYSGPGFENTSSKYIEFNISLVEYNRYNNDCMVIYNYNNDCKVYLSKNKQKYCFLRQQAK